jgi:hypothetical protein
MASEGLIGVRDAPFFMKRFPNGEQRITIIDRLQNVGANQYESSSVSSISSRLDIRCSFSNSL